MNKMGGINLIIISVISFLYILLITKLAEIISLQYVNLDGSNGSNGSDGQFGQFGQFSPGSVDNHVGVYVMIIYFISIIGIVVGYMLFNTHSNTKSELPNWIVRWSLSIGGVLMLIYTIINYWEYLNDYSKLLLIFLSITSIIYYLYKYY